MSKFFIDFASTYFPEVRPLQVKYEYVYLHYFKFSMKVIHLMVSSRLLVGKSNPVMSVGCTGSLKWDFCAGPWNPLETIYTTF